MPAFATMADADVEQLVAHMLDAGILFEDGGVLGIGPGGEKQFGRRHFMELMSVFTSPPLFHVLHGREDLGQVDALSFAGGEGRQRVLLLGGRSWRVTNIDWNRRLAHVERVEGRGASRWRGGGPMLGFRFCRAMRDVLTGDDGCDWWSRRAREALDRIRVEFAWLAADGTTLRRSGSDAAAGAPEWWTFAGTKVNATLASVLRTAIAGPLDADACSIRFGDGLGLDAAERAIAAVRASSPNDVVPEASEDAVDSLKFSRCLPPGLAEHVVGQRLADAVAVHAALTDRIRVVVEDDTPQPRRA